MRVPRHKPVVIRRQAVHHFLVPRRPPRRWSRLRRRRLSVGAGNRTPRPAVGVSPLPRRGRWRRNRDGSLVAVGDAVSGCRSSNTTGLEIHVGRRRGYRAGIGDIGLAGEFGPEARFLGPRRRRHGLGLMQRRSVAVTVVRIGTGHVRNKLCVVVHSLSLKCLQIWRVELQR